MAHVMLDRLWYQTPKHCRWQWLVTYHRHASTPAHNDCTLQNESKLGILLGAKSLQTCADKASKGLLETGDIAKTADTSKNCCVWKALCIMEQDHCYECVEACFSASAALTDPASVSMPVDRPSATLRPHTL